MSELSVLKLNKFKKIKNLTNKKIAEITGIAHVTIDSIFSGKNKNPTIASLLKIAEVLECVIDDLIEYDKDSPLANYCEQKKINELVLEFYNNKNLNFLLKEIKKLNQNDLQLISDIIKRFNNNLLDENLKT